MKTVRAVKYLSGSIGVLLLAEHRFELLGVSLLVLSAVCSEFLQFRKNRKRLFSIYYQSLLMARAALATLSTYLHFFTNSADIAFFCLLGIAILDELSNLENPSSK